LRTAKYTLLIIGLVCLPLIMTACAKKGERQIPDAFTQMAKYKAVRILTNAVNMPFEFGSGTGVQGFDVDIAQEIAKDLGWPDIKWVKQSYDQLATILTNGEAEMVISAYPVSTPMTPEQSAEVAFSQTYFDSYDGIARRKDKPEIKDLASLAGKKVGVEAGSTGEAFMKSQKTAAGVTLTSFSTLDDGLGALNRTEIDAMIGDGTILTYSIYKSFQNLVALELRLTETHYAVVVRKSEPKLLKSINDTLARLKSSGQLAEGQKKWFQNVMEEAATQRDGMYQEEALKDAPKSVTIEMVKTAAANFPMDRLDGYVAELVGSTGSFKSEPILTNGNRGTVKFPTAVPPGKYELRMSIFKIIQEIPIPKKAAKAVAFTMTIGQTIKIDEK
jgi:ABC-type amino acid transport substrate-binding protein